MESRGILTPEAIAEALAGDCKSRRTSTGWLTLCPVHEDRNPSLSVSEGKDGGILVHCFGGCAQKAVVDELKARNLWPSSNGERPQAKGKAMRKLVATYDYQDAAGALAYQVCRFVPKDFRQRRPDPKNPKKWLWNLDGVTRLPYRLPELLAADPAAPVFIPEGEKDADRLAALGLAATCNSEGAGKWRPELNQYFRGRRGVILADNDAAGREHALKVAQALCGIAASVKVLDLPGLPPKGDVSDWLTAGSSVARLLELAEAAPDWKPQARSQDTKEEQGRNGSKAQTIRPRAPEIHFITSQELQSTEFKEPEWVVEGILPEGLCLLSARPKKGKTWLAMGVSAAKSTGGCAFGRADLRLSKSKVLYLALEDRFRRAKKRLGTILGTAAFPKDLVIAEDWPRLDKGGLAALQDFLKEHDDCKLVVIDSYTKIKPPRPKNTDPYDFDMGLGGVLQTLAQEHRVCILLIYHNRKAESEDPLDDVIGSTGLTGAVDAVLILRRGRGQADGTLFITGRDVEEQEVALKFHPREGLWELMGDAAEYAKSQERQEILRVLREHGSKTPTELSIILNKEAKNIKALLWKMAGDGEVKSVKGKYEPTKR